MKSNRSKTQKNQQAAGDELVQKIFADFEAFAGAPEEAELLGKNAWNLILELRLAQLGKETASATTKKQLIETIRQLALSWDADDASLSTTQKIFNRLAAGRYVDAIKLAESSINEKIKAKKIILRGTGKTGGQKKNQKGNDTIKKALEYYKMNHSKWVGRGRKKAAAYELEEKFPPIKASTYLRHLKSHS
jgi:hypothetical protein